MWLRGLHRGDAYLRSVDPADVVVLHMAFGGNPFRASLATAGFVPNNRHRRPDLHSVPKTGPNRRVIKRVSADTDRQANDSVVMNSTQKHPILIMPHPQPLLLACNNSLPAEQRRNSFGLRLYRGFLVQINHITVLELYANRDGDERKLSPLASA